MRNLLAWLVLSLVLSSGPAHAQGPGDSAPVAVSALSDEAIAQRLDWLDGKLASAQTPAAWWWYGWFATYSALTVGATVIYFASDGEEVRQDMAVGAVESLLGVGAMFFTPMRAISAASELRSLPASTRPEREGKLRRAESLLQECARDEAEGQSWLNHVLSFGLNLAGGLVIWQGFDRPFTDGLLNFAEGMIVSEIQIWTQPMRSLRAQEAYTSTYPRLASLRLLPLPGGLAVAGSF